MCLQISKILLVWVERSGNCINWKSLWCWLLWFDSLCHWATSSKTLGVKYDNEVPRYVATSQWSSLFFFGFDNLSTLDIIMASISSEIFRHYAYLKFLDTVFINIRPSRRAKNLDEFDKDGTIVIPCCIGLLFNLQVLKAAFNEVLGTEQSLTGIPSPN
jgi:hypothetical protein